MHAERVLVQNPCRVSLQVGASEVDSPLNLSRASWARPLRPLHGWRVRAQGLPRVRKVPSPTKVEAEVETTYWSTWLRLVSSESGRVRTPRATGDHGIEPTPNISLSGLSVGSVAIGSIV